MQSKYDIKNPSKTHVILQLVEVVVVIRPQILMVDIGGLIVAQCSI